MEINNLEMISFRNHRKTNIDFDPGLTIIWGENGSGKTSILEAIHISEPTRRDTQSRIPSSA